MRKKHLKSALAAASASNDALGASNTKLARERDSLKVANAQLTEANVKLSGRLNEALAANRKFATQQRTQNELFGKALVQVQPETGPSRPNRHKLTRRDVKDIRDAYYGGAKQKDLARNYGVNPATISRLVRGVYH
ncbi:helix-turn-helix DNA-binding domain protein [Mycobacterium phage Acolyte]|nr:helix-turn-helix DNA-binding domain protein [Mycobacterium phage Acolyte]